MRSVITLRQTLFWTLSNLVIFSPRLTSVRALTFDPLAHTKMANTTDYTVSYVTIDSQEKAEQLASYVVPSTLYEIKS